VQRRLEFPSLCLELLDFRQSPGSHPSDVDLELKPLPSTGITRLQRYYEPLRHPGKPGLYLAVVRLDLRPPARASRVASGFPLHTCHRHYPGETTGLIVRPFPATAAFPVTPSGRLPHHPFFEACSAFTHVTACMCARSPLRPSTPWAPADLLPPRLP
jgi:hypothetical protein